MSQFRAAPEHITARPPGLWFEGLAVRQRGRIRHVHAPMTIWCHQPQAWTPDAAVLFVMHGVHRNARNYRDVWRKYADRHNFLLLVPEFSRQHYPDTRAYTLGARSSSSQTLSSQTLPRTAQVIEEIFDAAKALLSFRATSYCMYGHSAGAQFVHRFLLFSPEARVNAAICANAGWYTMVTEAVRFPYGLKGSGMTAATLARAFEKKLVILLGDQDTNQHHAHLKRSARARAQGKNRFERGKRFYDLAARKADELRVPFKWELHVIHGVGHSNAHMAKRALQYLPEIGQSYP